MTEFKKGQKFGNSFISNVDKKSGAITLTISNDPPPPDWEEIAKNLFDAMEDINLFLDSAIEPKSMHRANERFLQKKFRKAFMHLENYEGTIMTHEEADKLRESYRGRMAEMLSK